MCRGGVAVQRECSRRICKHQIQSSTGHIHAGERSARAAAEQRSAAEAQRARPVCSRHEPSQQPQCHDLPRVNTVRPQRPCQTARAVRGGGVAHVRTRAPLHSSRPGILRVSAPTKAVPSEPRAASRTGSSVDSAPNPRNARIAGIARVAHMSRGCACGRPQARLELCSPQRG
jgi:hypothetical protein